MIPAGLRRVGLVARIRLIRQYRSTVDQPWIAFLQVVAVLFGVVFVVGRLPVPGYAAVWHPPGAYEYGRRLATGASILPTARGFAGVVFVLLVFLTVLKETTDGAIDTNADALLLATDARTVAAGEVVWSTLFAGWQFGVPLLAGAVAFGVGAGSPIAGVGVAVGGGVLVAAAVPTGYVLALAIRFAFQSLPTLRENKVVLGAPLAVAYFALFLDARRSIAVLAEVPLGWFGDLGLLFAQRAGANPVRATTVVVTVPVLVVGLIHVAGRLGGATWYGDRPRTEPASRDGIPRPISVALGVVASGPTAAVTRTVWIRLVREPRVLIFAALPIALTATFGMEVVARRPRALPVVVAVYVAAAVGMGATLNPLGNVGAGLSATLTTPGGGRALVHGYVLSAVVPGVPVVLGLTMVTGIVVGLGPLGVVSVVIVGGVLTVGAGVVSLWIGTGLPNYDSLRATSESGVRPPRLLATTAFLVVILVLGSPAVVGVGWGSVLAAGVGFPASIVGLVGVGITCLGTAMVSSLAYRRSLSAIAGYRIA